MCVTSDILAAGDRGIAQDAVGDELGVFDKVGGMADDTRHQDLLLRYFRLLPHAPFMLGCWERWQVGT